MSRLLRTAVAVAALAAASGGALAAASSSGASPLTRAASVSSVRGTAVRGTAVRGTTTSTSTSTTTTSTTSTSTSTTTAPPGTPVVLARGGVVRVAVPALPANLNPFSAAGSTQVTAEIASLVWPSVFATGPGGGPQPQTSFVSSAEVIGVPPSAPLTVQYQIDPHARWSDGVPITAADFVYLWQQLRHASGLPATVPLAGYRDIASIGSSNGGKTATVVFTKPYADWSSLFADLVPAHLGKLDGFSRSFSLPGSPGARISGGPFAVSSEVPGKQLVLARNPRYWGTPARLSRIVFTVVRGESQVIQDLELGTIDLAEVTPNASVSADVARSGTLVEQVAASPTLWQLVYNLADPLLAHPTMRQAVTDLVNRTELLWDTVGTETNSPVIGATHLFQSGYPGSIGHDNSYKQSNLGEAFGLLAAAGYTRNSAGLVTNAAGAPVVLHLLAPSANPLVARTVAVLTSQLIDAGVTLQTTYVPLRQLLRHDLPTGSYQIALAPYDLSAEASQNVSLYSSPVGPTLSPFVQTGHAPVLAPLSMPAVPAAETEPGAALSGRVTRDVSGYSNPAVDALAAQAFSQLNPAKTMGDYNRIDAVLWHDLPTVPLFQAPVALVMRDDLVNVEYVASPAGAFWNAAQWGIQVSPPPAPAATGS